MKKASVMLLVLVLLLCVTSAHAGVMPFNQAELKSIQQQLLDNFGFNIRIVKGVRVGEMQPGVDTAKVNGVDATNNILVTYYLLITREGQVTMWVARTLGWD